jgi:hypothetical protein
MLANIIASPTLANNFAATVELHSTFIKQIKADYPHVNLSEVNYSSNKQHGGNNSSDKRGSSGISNASNDDVADHFLRIMSIML